MKQWQKIHQEPSTEYRNRAEERRKAVGSTAFTRPRPPVPNAYEPVIPGKSTGSDGISGGFGYSVNHNASGGKRFDREGLKKGDGRTGLGYEESKKSAYSSMILEGDFFTKK